MVGCVAGFVVGWVCGCVVGCVTGTLVAGTLVEGADEEDAGSVCTEEAGRDAEEDKTDEGSVGGFIR